MTFTDAPSPYLRNACTTTADSVVRSASARSCAARFTSTGMRTAVTGVCVAFGTSAARDLGGPAASALAERREHLRVRRAAADGAQGARRLGDLLLTADGVREGGVVGGDSGCGTGGHGVLRDVGVYGQTVARVYGHVKGFA
jgi:hypothetical protein